MEAFDLQLPGVRLHALARGPADGPLALCVPGLSANALAFDAIGGELERRGFRVVAVDKRGRGRSEVTPPGTYGLEAHAGDVLAAADALGAEEFHLLGWSLGALIGIVTSARAPERVRTLTLIDHAGHAAPEAIDAVRAGLARLQAVVPAPDEYVAAIRFRSPIVHWERGWDAFYRYELGERADGTWSPTTDPAACLEDLERAAETDVHALWPALSMPVLLLRCAAPLNGGFVVPEDEARAFASAAPGARVLEVAANHFDVMTDPAALAAIAQLVTAQPAER